MGCHGYSLLGNTAYATLAASHAPDAPPSRPLVTALVPAISFSRIQRRGWESDAAKVSWTNKRP